MKHVYLIKSIEDGYYKIGISKHPSKRIEELNTGNSSSLKLVEAYKSEHANQIEKILQRKYSFFRKNGEWFDLSLNVEIDFNKDCQIIEKNLIELKKSSNVFV
jgi:predicted GIY-YIG superfamily endonuclease